MKILYLLQNCTRSILRNMMRSLLTSLGIIIGVASVVIMTAIGQGAQDEIEARISSMGTNLLQIQPQRVVYRGGQSMTGFSRFPRVTVADRDKIVAENSYAAAVSALVQRNFTCIGTDGSASVSVMGVEESYLTIRDWKIDRGAMFGEEENTERQRVAVLGSETAISLFGSAEGALGQNMRLGDGSWIIVGVLETHGDSTGFQNTDDVVLVPYRTYLTRLAPSKNLSSIVLSVVDKSYMDAAQREVEAIMRESHNLPDNVVSDFGIMNSTSLIEMAGETSRNLTILLAAIAGVSLLVGGIGIMNIMLVSVTERTREIGIRMAVGARKQDILLQFLAEACILSIAGGMIGILLSYAACRVLAVFNIPTAILPLIVLLAALFSLFVGIVFGYYPAKKAARLYPIEALRYE
ncbi:MAG: ABC transporter permease [Treponema sp.]|jgi:putative ABC transport system permease protein|nr:ABC transporter permease [Treponema sp.]